MSPFAFAFATHTHNKVIPAHVISPEQLDAHLEGLSAAQRTWAQAQGFKGHIGEALALPTPDGNIDHVLLGYGTAQSRARKTRFVLAYSAAKLPQGTYELHASFSQDEWNSAALGWLLLGYQFDRYKTRENHAPKLIAPSSVDAPRIEAMAAAEAKIRDLINTPAQDMGPAELDREVHNLAHDYDATVQTITGDELLKHNFPMIHAVGRAAPPSRAPRLMDLRWGSQGPKITLVGKGISFDTGGLNIKPGGSMGLMKKDMGGAATVIGLAQMIMALNLPIQLRMLIPSAENSISGDSFRPQDIFKSRKGLSVEINNTDAEGRLILADALAYASEDNPDLVISMATLTGAARVALGPDLPAFFTQSDAHAQSLMQAGIRVEDPLWRLPFYTPYDSMIEPDIADLDNAPKGGMAGAITAALFLRRFVDTPYIHFDIYGWNPTAADACPKGGIGLGARALLDALPDMLDLHNSDV